MVRLLILEVVDSDKIDLEVVGSYWYINGENTFEVAKRIIDYIEDTDDEYVHPVIEISRAGRWVVNGNETIIPVENNVLILEVFITILLILIVDPLMNGISLLLKRFRLAIEE